MKPYHAREFVRSLHILQRLLLPLGADLHLISAVVAVVVAVEEGGGGEERGLHEWTLAAEGDLSSFCFLFFFVREVSRILNPSGFQIDPRVP